MKIQNPTVFLKDGELYCRVSESEFIKVKNKLEATSFVFKVTSLGHLLHDTLYTLNGYEAEVKKYSCSHTKAEDEIECPLSTEEFPDCCGTKERVATITPISKDNTVDKPDFRRLYNKHVIETSHIQRSGLKIVLVESLKDILTEMWDKYVLPLQKENASLKKEFSEYTQAYQKRQSEEINKLYTLLNEREKELEELKKKVGEAFDAGDDYCYYSNFGKVQKPNKAQWLKNNGLTDQ